MFRIKLFNAAKYIYTSAEFVIMTEEFFQFGKFLKMSEKGEPQFVPDAAYRVKSVESFLREEVEVSSLSVDN